MNCYAHPAVETNLRCGKCGKPICTRCLVQTPVGGRCRECARLYRLPTYQVSIIYYVRAIVAGIAVATACGVLWWLARGWVPMFYLNFVLAAGAGYGIGEVVSRSVNRKRGRGLAVVAGASVAASYLISVALRGGFPLSPLSLVSLAFDLLAVALGVFIAARYFVVK